MSSQILWTPERVADSDVLSKIQSLGYSATILDQVQHLRRWFGYNASVGDGAYRVNRINDLVCLMISGQANEYRFGNLDNGTPLLLRQLLSRRARSGAWSGQHPQVLVFFTNWEDFGDKSKADAYDKNIAWMASRGWIQFVSADDILGGHIDISLPPDGSGDAWNDENRGTGLSLPKTSHDWVQYGSRERLRPLVRGPGLNQGLQHTQFQIRPGTNVPDEYGMTYFGGLVSGAWSRVAALPDGPLARLAEAALHASVFETAYHNQSQNPVNMTRYTLGEFAYPDNSYDTLAGFARIAQSQTRMAAVYERVDDWQAVAASITNVQTAAADVDLDGESEYLLYNDRVFGLFERSGGRLVAVWVRDILNGDVFQAAGNFASYAGSDNEDEGATNILSNGSVGAFRTSCLKDWWAGTTKYVNDLYSFVDWTNGWRATSSDGALGKTVTLAPKSGVFEVAYALSGGLAGQPLYVRNGLSPNLYDLLLHGQQTLGGVVTSGMVLRLANTNYGTTVAASIGRAGAGYNPLARDDGNGYTNFTMPMRNQAQTYQVELVGTNAFSFSLGFTAVPSDWDGDGMPNTYEDAKSFSPTNSADGAADEDLDHVPNWEEYVANTDPRNIGEYLSATAARPSATGIVVRFPTKTQREYFIHYGHSLAGQNWILATSNGIAGTGGTVEWVDDGSQTQPGPTGVTNRFYRIRVALPE